MKKKIFKSGLFLLIIAFLGLYFAYANGYYEKKQGDKVVLTNEMIEAFEQDVSEGKNISIDDYLKEEKDYSTKSTKMSLNLAAKASNLLDSMIKFVFQKLGSALE